jgi:hypothetical protein
LAAAQSSMSTDAAEPTVVGSIDIPPPPPGEGQVVFFRKKSILGIVPWFNVREDGKALGKLTSGVYFVQVTTPGVHTYTATSEPEATDKLRIEVDPGETYFVEGTVNKGVVIGNADMSPSDRASFDTASKNLALAPPPTDDKMTDQAADKATPPTSTNPSPAAPSAPTPASAPTSTQ